MKISRTAIIMTLFFGLCIRPPIGVAQVQDKQSLTKSIQKQGDNANEYTLKSLAVITVLLGLSAASYNIFQFQKETRLFREKSDHFVEYQEYMNGVLKIYNKSYVLDMDRLELLNSKILVLKDLLKNKSLTDRQKLYLNKSITNLVFQKNIIRDYNQNSHDEILSLIKDKNPGSRTYRKKASLITNRIEGQIKLEKILAKSLDKELAFVDKESKFKLLEGSCHNFKLLTQKIGP